MYFDLVLLAYLTYKNGMRAKLKAQNAVLWSVITLVCVTVTYFIGFVFVAMVFCAKNVNMQQLSSVDVKTKQAIAQQIVQAFSDNPLHLITVELFGLGGYLLIRYILNRRPDKKEPEVHWMDKINDPMA